MERNIIMKYGLIYYACIEVQWVQIFRARDESAGTGSKFLGSGLSRVLYFGLGLVMGT